MIDEWSLDLSALTLPQLSGWAFSPQSDLEHWMQGRAFADNTEKERIEIFQEYFDRDIESAYSSSICCCEQCFDDFSAEWPGTATRDIDMQKGQSSLLS